MRNADWEHGLGGLHAMVWEGAELIGHASVVQRRLIHRERPLRTGYIENVGVRIDRRGEGHAAAMMAPLEQVVRGGYHLGALGASEDAVGFYEARDWQQWRGPTSALSPTGIRPTPEEDGSIYVLPGSAPLDLDAGLTCDWREGDVW